MKLLIVADDFGASRSVTNHILQGHRAGVITHASLLVNGFDAAYAAEQFTANPNLQVSIHLNLIEGRSVSAPQDVSMLVDHDGYFNHTFISLWIKYLLFSAKKKKLMHEQVVHELTLQLQLIKKMVANKKIVHVDSHQHVHMVPFIFDALVECYDSDAVLRIPYERFQFVYFKKNWKQFKIINFIKQQFLNLLAKKAYRIACSKKIVCTDHLIGIILGGQLDARALEYSLVHLKKISQEDAIVEILFHPGYATSDEAAIWNRYPKFRNFYRSPERISELAMIQSTHMRELMAQLGNSRHL